MTATSDHNSRDTHQTYTHRHEQTLKAERHPCYNCQCIAIAIGDYRLLGTYLTEDMKSKYLHTIGYSVLTHNISTTIRDTLQWIFVCNSLFVITFNATMSNLEAV